MGGEGNGGIASHRQQQPHISAPPPLVRPQNRLQLRRGRRGVEDRIARTTTTPYFRPNPTVAQNVQPPPVNPNPHRHQRAQPGLAGRSLSIVDGALDSLDRFRGGAASSSAASCDCDEPTTSAFAGDASPPLDTYPLRKLERVHATVAHDCGVGRTRCRAGRRWARRATGDRPGYQCPAGNFQTPRAAECRWRGIRQKGRGAKQSVKWAMGPP